MHAHQFGGHSFFGFGDIATFQKQPNFPFEAWTSPWSLKNLINRSRLKKFMQVGTDVECMHIDFGGRDPSDFRNKISLWLIKVGKFSHSELAQKIHASRD